MELNHEFTVPIGKAEAWAMFNDIGSIATCFPGATVTSADDDGFEGSVKVKLGPIALLYNGAGTFTEKDEDAGRMLISAKGKDRRGNGTAGAEVAVAFAETDPGSTLVTVVTQLQITGKPAQFGRGVMQDVSDKLLGQFVECLEKRFEPEAAPDPAPSAETDAEEAATGRHASPPSTASAAPPPAAQPSAPSSGSDAIDLGGTVLPVLVKSYGKQVLGVALVLLALGWLLRRRRRS